MKTTIQKLLVAALLISMISPVIVAQPQKTEIKTNDEPRGKLQDTKNASLKNKIVTALGVAAALVVAYAFYKYKTRPDAELDADFKYQQANAPQEQSSVGRAGNLWHYSMAFNDNFKTAMRDPVAAHNITTLFNNQEFINLLQSPNAELVVEHLRGVFNEREIIQRSANNNFVQTMIQRTAEIINGLVTP